MKGWWVVALVALAACGNEADPRTGGDLPEQDAPVRPPEANAEGTYTLTAINGGGLPGVVQEERGCRVEVVEASLRLLAGRFAFQNRTREVCGATPSEPVLHAAGGTFTLVDGVVVLRSDVGSAFTEARGRIDSTTITLDQLSTEGGAETVTWRLDRQDHQQAAPGGTTGGDSTTTGGR